MAKYENFPGLAALCLNLGEPVTGAPKEWNQSENKRKIKGNQDEQVPPEYFSSHRGKLSIPAPNQATEIVLRKNICLNRIA